MSITTTRGRGQSDSNPRLSKRPPRRSLKRHKAISVIMQYALSCESFNTIHIYQSVTEAGFRWNSAKREWKRIQK